MFSTRRATSDLCQAAGYLLRQFVRKWLILDSAEYEEVPLEPQEQEASMATVEEQAVPGEMSDPNKQPESPPPQP